MDTRQQKAVNKKSIYAGRLKKDLFGSVLLLLVTIIHWLSADFTAGTYLFYGVVYMVMALEDVYIYRKMKAEQKWIEKSMRHK
ncbi:hypothetical protein [Marinococcus sp. PL1-022]|uniref:hypothetical protein n=1 Tax=Marinococcus sp. PL1-022 TaxID=3095363 RepID=UPI0029C400F7|nr:hypothetical protein [Marinococcus sp. PL1-022]MDX6151728.1 hypothetical protein [Marinococcus sp. PL1-022]